MGTVKAFLVPAFLVVATASWADDLASARQMIAETYGRLALKDMVHINVSGDVTVGDERQPFAIQMVVKRVQTTNSTQTIYFEGLVVENGMTTHRYVGDGDPFWVYDALKNTYSVVDYGSATTPAQQGSRLFNTLKRVTSGPSQFAAGFLADIDRCRTSGSVAVADTWTPYISTAVITTSGLGIACNARAPQAANLTYGFQRDADGLLWFSSATYESTKSIGAKLKKTSWNLMSIDTPPSTMDFTFDRGTATPVSITVAQGGSGGG